MQITRAAIDDLPDLQTLFLEYPFKGFQHKAQGLDAPKLAAFFTEGMRSAIASEATAVFVAREGGRLLGAAALSPNEWHGRFYGKSMGRCSTFLAWRDPRMAAPALIEALRHEAAERSYAMLSVRIDGGEFEVLHALEASGFSLIDVSVKMGAPIRGGAAFESPGITVRPYEPSDRGTVVRISGDAHVANHFFNDVNLDRAATRTLFRAWVERCIDSLSPHVFVAEDARGEPIGFATYLVSRRFNEALGVRLAVLDYIVLDSAAQGRGIGRALLEQSLAALRDLYDQAELRTSHNNYPALSLYGRYGFRVLGTDFLLHQWQG